MARPLALAALLLAAAAGCTTPCEELGTRICECSPTGTSTDTCERQVSNAVEDADPSGSEKDRCDAYLDSCHAPAGVSFCDWLSSADGKAACGLAY